MRTPNLSRHGLAPAGPVFAYLSAAELVEHALRRGEGDLADSGAFNALTGERTARSPQDKYTVRDPSIEKEIDWGPTRRWRPRRSTGCLKKALAYANARELFVVDAAACADPDHRLTAARRRRAGLARPVRPLPVPPADRPRAGGRQSRVARPAACRACATTRPPRGSTRRSSIALSFERKILLVAGTHYAGEIKKSIFSVLNAACCR